MTTGRKRRTPNPAPGWKDRVLKGVPDKAWAHDLVLQLRLAKLATVPA